MIESNLTLEELVETAEDADDFHYTSLAIHYFDTLLRIATAAKAVHSQANPNHEDIAQLRKVLEEL